MNRDVDRIDIAQAYDALDKGRVLNWVKDQLVNKVPPQRIAEELSRDLERLGEQFASGERFIPELMVGGEMFREAMELIRPRFEEGGLQRGKIGTFLIGTVKGDLHDLGKNLVSITLGAGGFEVVDLGKDVSVECFISEIERIKPNILGMSALLSTTMEVQREVVDALNNGGLRKSTKVIVGGAPVNQRWADSIGADAYGADAIDALRKAKQLLKIC
jgi:methanogenic corrinoid protein MtbC1